MAQLVQSSSIATADLHSLHKRCKDGSRQPDRESLMDCLSAVLSSLAAPTYIVVDALDERCDIPELRSLISDIRTWNRSNLHTLLTSRRLKCIEDSLGRFLVTASKVNIQSNLVNQDISKYVHQRLRVDPGLRRWQNSPAVKEEIRSSLLAKADGM